MQLQIHYQNQSRSSDVYVPRDEAFSEIKNLTFNTKTVFSVLKAVLPWVETSMIDQDLGLLYFTAIDKSIAPINHSMIWFFNLMQAHFMVDFK
ncbi:putative linoleate 13S-lipoxygenase [Helianthus anomalus]